MHSTPCIQKSTPFAVLRFSCGSVLFRLWIAFFTIQIAAVVGAISSEAREGFESKKPKGDLEQAFREANALNRAAEFPNPFQVGGLDPVLVRKALQRTLHAWANRLVFVKKASGADIQSLQNSQNSQNLKHPSALEEVYVAESLLKIAGPSARVFLAGDGVRDLLAEIYLAVHRLHREKPHLNSVDLLAEIDPLSNGSEGARRIDALEVLRPGSRWAFPLEFGGQADPRDRRGLFEQLKKEFSVARENFKTHAPEFDIPEGQFLTRFPPGHFKLYSDYLESIAPFAHFPLHFLALDLDSGELRSAVGDPQAVLDDFVAGTMRFSGLEVPLDSPLLPSLVAPGAVHLVAQGLHLLLQFPFLSFAEAEPDGSRPQDLFEDHLANLYLGLQLQPSLRSSYKPALTRAILGHSEGGAHNRFLRGESHLDELARELMKMREDWPSAYSESKDSQLFHFSGLPCFSGPGSMCSPASLPELPAEAWMEPSEFLAKHTDCGILYHGAPMCGTQMKEGPPISHPNYGGTAAMGSGFYTTRSVNEARGYCQTSGFVHPLRVKTEGSSRLRILDWGKVKDTLLGKEFETLAEKLNRPVFEILSTLYGIDVCLNEYPIFQSMRTLELARNPLESLERLRGAFSRALEKGDESDGSWNAFEGVYGQLKRTHLLAHALGYESSKFSDWFDALFAGGNVALSSRARHRLEVLRYASLGDSRLAYLNAHRPWALEVIEAGDTVAMQGLAETPEIGKSPLYGPLGKALLATRAYLSADFFKEIGQATREVAEQLIEMALRRETDSTTIIFFIDKHSPVSLEPYLLAAVEDWQSGGPANVGDYLRFVPREFSSRAVLLQKLLHSPANFRDPGTPYLMLARFLAFYPVKANDEAFVLGLFSLPNPSSELAELRLKTLADFREKLGKPLLGAHWDPAFKQGLADLVGVRGKTSGEGTRADMLPRIGEKKRVRAAEHLLKALEGRPVLHFRQTAEAVLIFLSQEKVVRERLETYHRLLGRSFSPQRVLRVFHARGDAELSAAMVQALKLRPVSEDQMNRLIESLIR